MLTFEQSEFLSFVVQPQFEQLDRQCRGPVLSASACAIRSFNSPFNFFIQFSNFHQHLQQAKSDIEIVLIDRADKNRRKRLLEHPLAEPASTGLSHPTQ
ncbi:unnamed protein product, partial [Rotaria magnacalcarata]